ncbi:AraC family transcriptional regulator [Paenibacillus nanensis]|uniref:AraC family transcriptional regulator n=2 Tax=Paenibacillus nanensis TaxID=393251 RepID=A0A3A1UI57_9BACL|nr:AraC family transcriptional regulator [Paenibacillus nanensis]
MSNYLITVNSTPEPIKAVSRFEGRDHERVARVGETAVFLPGNLSYFRLEKIEASFSCIMLSTSLVHQVASQADLTVAGYGEWINQINRYDSKLFQLSKWLEDEINNNGARGKLYIESLSNLTALQLLEICNASHRKPFYVSRKLSDPQLARAIEYMNVHFDRDISLDELAKVVNLSQTHLIRMFKQTTRLSPYQYFIHLRIDKAKMLIKSREYTIGEIAAILGFSDQSHLNRHFKRVTGLSPREYLST